MFAERTLMLTIGIVAIAANASSDALQPVMLDRRWRATLVAPSAPDTPVLVAGSASMAPGDAPGSTTVMVFLRGATPKSVHPWAVHRGKCDHDGGVLGHGGEYPPIAAGWAGDGSATATLRVETPAAGAYSVVVQAAATNMETITACGELSPQAP